MTDITGGLQAPAKASSKPVYHSKSQQLTAIKLKRGAADRLKMMYRYIAQQKQPPPKAVKEGV